MFFFTGEHNLNFRFNSILKRESGVRLINEVGVKAFSTSYCQK